MESKSATFKALIGMSVAVFLGCLPAGYAAAQTCVQPPSGLENWWPGDGDANDIVGAKHGTLQNGATFAAGKLGQAFSLDGVNDYIDLPDTRRVTGQSAVSIHAWINRDSDTDGHIYFEGLSGNTTFSIVVDAGNQFGVSLRSNVTETSTTGAGTGVNSLPPPGDWVHVAATVDLIANEFKVYINGVDATANSRNNTTETSFGDFPNNVHIGIASFFPAGGFDRPFKGRIDELEIYHRVLSDVEIQAIYKCKVADADAGADQAVDEGTIVTLDGSQSSGIGLSYLWEQIAGPAVVLTDETTTHPSFGAPQLPRGVGGNQTLTFRLTITDSGGQSDNDTVDVTVKNVNHAPVADAGSDQTVNEGSPVTLSAMNSYDPDGDPISCEWAQAFGPTCSQTSVTLSGASTCEASFIAPLIPGGLGASEVFCFDVTVSDGDCSLDALCVTDSANVTAEQVNHGPTANAGPDQTKVERNAVTLDGTGSEDPDDDPLSYSWSQSFNTGCDTILASLSNPSSATPSFTAPEVGPGGATLCFDLEVRDPGPLASTDEVRIHVQNFNDRPACGLAQASPGTLWPPNHKLISVGIVGVTDPDKNAVTITISGVTQDEPTSGLRNGDTSPDAILQGETVLLRAERASGGNGRVYRVSFTADDGNAGICTGSVNVDVPPNMTPGNAAIDDGQTHDSTQP